MANNQRLIFKQGIRKVEQSAIMDAFVSKTSQNVDLEESSFLTTLDMDTATVPTYSQNQSGFLTFGNNSQDLPGTPPLSTAAARFTSLGMGGAIADKGRGGGGGAQTEVSAQRAFNDLRRFGSMLVGRRETSDSRGR